MSRKVSIYVVVIYLVSTRLHLSRHTLLSIPFRCVNGSLFETCDENFWKISRVFHSF